jgi:hypothetical protein
MKRFKLGLRNRSADEQLDICERVVARIAALPADQHEPTQLADANTTVTALRASQQRIATLRTELRTEITNRNQLMRLARDRVYRATLGVGVKNNFDPAKVAACGVEFEAPKNIRVGKPGAVESLCVASHDLEGTIALRWKRPIRRCSFEVQVRVEPFNGSEWQMNQVSISQKCLVKGLKSGVKYWFRVRAINAHGEGPWSGSVSARVR